MAKATARHILVDSEEQCQSLKDEIEGGADFAELAKQHSSCPSGQRGGDLGEFGPGMMVPEFDKVVFSADVGTGGKFQIPSLLGVGMRFPYMHDGCAETLADRFGPCGGGDAHGKTSHLSEADVNALVVYLQSL